MKIWALFVYTGSCVYNKKVYVSHKQRLQASVVSLSGLPNEGGKETKLVHLITKHPVSGHMKQSFLKLSTANPYIIHIHK